METLEQEIKELIIDVLVLEDVTPGDIDPEAALFVEGLGLDSIDALELAIAIDKHFGVRMKPDDEQTRSVFASVKALAHYLQREMAAQSASAHN